MGTWGINIFDDDLALDVRDEYLEIVKDGLSTEEATKLIAERFEDEIGDPEESIVFWLGLAATQLIHRIIMPEVKEKAINIINQNADLDRWIHDSALYEGRKRVLEQLKEQLMRY